MTAPTVLSAALLAWGLAAANEYFTITVVDEQTGRGVPLVELRTVNGIRHTTDSNGVVAFRELGLMGQQVFFHVTSHGYEFPKDGFGFRGTALAVKPGGSAKLTVRRTNIAERLYRVTGAGIYRDSVLLGRAVPLKEPVLNGQVFGSDSVVNAVYRDKVYWFWGDTNRPGYPLGNFHVPGATSELPSRGGLDPEVGINLTYWLDDRGFAKETAKMPGKGPTWLTGVVVLPDGAKEERLFASYVKVEPPLKVYARGLAVFDDAQQRFEHLADVDLTGPAFPHGHPFRHTDGGVEYVYFAHPYPLTRVRASAEHFRRVDGYETFTCLQAGSRLDDPRLDRDKDGRLRYAWKKNTPAVGPQEQAKLVAAGKMRPEEALLLLRDRDTGKPVVAHAGSVCWNAHRQRWVLIATQSAGTSFLGEVWYAEADTPTGPWVYAVKVVTHDKYSFYNPKQHPMFDQHGGRVIFFEGTYTHTFSGNPEQTPRYDYNQIMYKLDLTDGRLALPVAVYPLPRDGAPSTFGTIAAVRGKDPRPPVAFFAVDRPVKGMVPVLPTKDGAPPALQVGKPLASAEVIESGALFYALSPDTKDPPPTATPLYEFIHRDGDRRAYTTNPRPALADYRRVEKPFCLVWRNPCENGTAK